MKTARVLAASLGIEDLVDLKLFSELCRIEAALVERHSVAEALAWCGENRGTLKKMDVGYLSYKSHESHTVS
jgi:macrophage erythroblast attacher